MNRDDSTGEVVEVLLVLSKEQWVAPEVVSRQQSQTVDQLVRRAVLGVLPGGPKAFEPG